MIFKELQVSCYEETDSCQWMLRVSGESPCGDGAGREVLHNLVSSMSSEGGGGGHRSRERGGGSLKKPRRREPGWQAWIDSRMQQSLRTGSSHLDISPGCSTLGCVPGSAMPESTGQEQDFYPK